MNIFMAHGLVPRRDQPDEGNLEVETRAHHLLIGGFVLLAIGAVFAFVIWLAGVQVDTEFEEYDIDFTSSVAGLSVGGDVRFNGIPVGSVRRILISPVDARRVRVTIRIQAGLPIKDDSYAVLEAQGLTGVSFVQISGGTIDSPLLVPREGEDRALIASRPSALASLLEGVPGVLREAVVTLDRVQSFLDESNKQKIGNILTNVETITGTVAGQSEAISATLAEMDDAIRDLRTTAQAVTQLAESGNAVLTEDMGAVLADARAMIQSVELLGGEVSAMVAENRDSVQTFTNGTLPEVSRLVIDIRRLVISLSRVAEKLEDNPAGLIFSPGSPEFGNENE